MLSFFKIVIVFVSFLLLSSCYDDLGNYEYQAIDDLSVNLPKVVKVKLPIAGAVACNLVPEITRSMGVDEQHLKYTWRRQITKNFITSWLYESSERDLRLWIKATETQRLIMRLDVVDTLTGIGDVKVVEIWKERPFRASWFVLQEIDGKAVLGCLDYSDAEPTVTVDIRSKVLGTNVNVPQETIDGKPRFMIGIPNYGQVIGAVSSALGIFTDQGGYLLDGTKLNVRYNYSQLLFLNQNQGITIDPQFATIDFGEVIINDGTFWFADADGTSVYYPVKLSEEAGTSYYASLAVASFYKGGAFVYDRQNKRFLYYNNQNLSVNNAQNSQIRGGNTVLYNPNSSQQIKLTSLKAIDGYTNLFDPNKLNINEMLFMGMNESNNALSQTKALAVGVGNEGICRIYELCFDTWVAQNGAVSSNFWEYTPKTDPTTWSMATSAYYDQTFYYAVDNQIYRVSLMQKVPKEYVVYTHPDPGVKLSHLKFQSPRVQSAMSEEGENGELVMAGQPQRLGVVVKYPDGREGIIALHLGANGMLQKEADGTKSVDEHTGFKNIVDIGYTFQFPF